MVKAADFAAQGEKHLGISYQEMDCQAFVECCLDDVGIHKDWDGSNAMYRDMTWLAPVEMAVEFFGSVPAGAFLFIWANDGGEVARGYTDGLGNASHVGIATGKPGDKGAIHSSSSRGCVAWSQFRNKSIPGGWNYVGLTNLLDYGEKINRILAECGQEPDYLMADGVVISENGKSVNVRRTATANSSVVAQLPVGTRVVVIEAAGAEWYKISFNGKEGYVMAKFLNVIPLTDETPNQPTNESEENSMQKTAVVNTSNGLSLNLRMGKSTSSAAAANIPNGTTLAVLDDTDPAWVKVSYNGKEGYVMRKFVTLTEAETSGSVTPAGSLEERVSRLEKQMARLTAEWEDKMGWG